MRHGFLQLLQEVVAANVPIDQVTVDIDLIYL